MAVMVICDQCGQTIRQDKDGKHLRFWENTQDENGRFAGAAPRETQFCSWLCVKLFTEERNRQEYS